MAARLKADFCQFRSRQLALGARNFNRGPLGPIAAEANVVSLPFVFKDVPHMFRILDSEGGKAIADGMAAKGLLPLAWYDAGARAFHNGDKAINTPADVMGMKVRVMNNDLFTSIILQLGGTHRQWPLLRSIRRSKPALWIVPKTTGHPTNPPGILKSLVTIPFHST